MALVAHLFDVITNGNSFAIRTMDSTAEAVVYDIEDACYRATSPKMVEAELAIYGEGKIIQRPIIRSNTNGIVITYPNSYETKLAAFFKEYQTVLVEKWNLVLQNLLLKWFKGTFEFWKKKLGNKTLWEWVKLGLEFIKAGLDFIPK